MEITHSKGTLYPALQLSSFRVRRDSLPPAFELPQEVARAVNEPLPALRSTSVAREALRESETLLRENEREQRAAEEKIAREQALMEEELTRIVEETEQRKSKENAAKAKKVRDMMSLMGVSDRYAAEVRLERCGWDYEKAATAFLETVN
ncbi:expressed unknown protein [Ectocarpus siliculosus]|uniref:UBA domain-containing protein n=1 Tax=Ectocarpus siliculosus TaxID=2880 RepID=D7FUM7_ECTSI|nr:expressed unknown protein [Ectocarpus siliculosus]|eukprot:CBJ31694.1 expressed unknown protein [Ectocarpus siliculosus]